MRLENITNPGETPVEGDLVKRILNGGTSITHVYHEPKPIPPAKPEPLTRKQFMDLLGFTKLVAFETAQETNPTLRVVGKYLDNSEYVDLEDASTATLLGVLVNEGILTQDEADKVLSGVAL